MSKQALLIVGLASLALFGCKKKQSSPAETVRAEGTRADAVARCEAAGRDDRDVMVASAPGSVHPNIRRVYGYVGTGLDRRRVLLCREVDTNFDGTNDVVRTYGDQGEKIAEQADSDFDGRIDTWITFAGSRPGRIEIDKSGDGKADEVRYYVEGELVRIQRDTNADGQPDIFEVYKNGDLQRMGVDADFDGAVDRWDRDEETARAEAEKEEAAAKDSSGEGDEDSSGDGG